MIEKAIKIIKKYLPACGESENIPDYVQDDVCKACEYAGVNTPPSGLTQKQFIALAASRIINKAEGVGISWASL